MTKYRTTYRDKHTVIMDALDEETGQLIARKVIMLNEYGSYEKDYQRMYWKGGVPDPLKGAEGIAEDD